MLQISQSWLTRTTIGLAVLNVMPAVGQTINEDIKIIASDRAEGDQFGNSNGIAIDNGVVVVAALGNDDFGSGSGSAYIFDALTGVQLFILLPSDGAEGDGFGECIAISNDMVAVGAHGDDDNGLQSGSAYLFDTSTGQQLFKLLPSDGEAGDRFGTSISISDGIVAVGAIRDTDNGTRSGSAYLFDAATGKQLFKLLPSDGSADDYFGISIDIDNGVVAVGSWFDDDKGTDSGSVYLFDASTGEQLFKLLPSDGAAGDEFGFSIAVDNGVVAIGARDDDFNGTDSGSAYLFEVSMGTQLAQLLPTDGAARDNFGRSIAIQNGLVSVGANRSDDNGTDSGSAYVFNASTGEQLFKLLPSDGAAGDEFGLSIAISNGVVAIGASLDDGNGENSGSAYVFDTIVEPCRADLVDDGTLDFFDVSVFLTYFQIGNPIADFTGDGQLDFFDVSAFLIAFSDGCR